MKRNNFSLVDAYYERFRKEFSERKIKEKKAKIFLAMILRETNFRPIEIDWFLDFLTVTEKNKLPPNIDAEHIVAEATIDGTEYVLFRL